MATGKISPPLGVRGADYDAIDVSGGNLTIDLSFVFKLIGTSIDYTAAGSFAGEGSWALANTSGDVVLNWTAVPEPASALLGGIGMLIPQSQRDSAPQPRVGRMPRGLPW